MVASREGDGLRVVVSLPIRDTAGMFLRAPAASYDPSGGFSPLLLELSDVLPAELYRPETWSSPPTTAKEAGSKCCPPLFHRIRLRYTRFSRGSTGICARPRATAWSSQAMFLPRARR